MPEIFDLYDENRIKTGKTMIRGNSTPDGYYRLVVHIAIFNSQGEMLIQQRQFFKPFFTGLWDISAGGSVISGETSNQAVERELFEELGIKHSFEDVRPSFTINFQNGYDDIYIIEKDIDIKNLKLQYEEVQAVKWASLNEILDMINKEEFVPYNKGFIDTLFFRRNHYDNFYKRDTQKNIIPVTFYDTISNGINLKYSVIIAKYKDKFVFCKHKERNTYEMPGGHIEKGETAEQAAKRELYEETGALEFTLKPICFYKVDDYGMLYYAEITKLEKKLHNEIEYIELFNEMPKNLTYPYIQPYLLIEAKKRKIIEHF